MPEIYCLGAPTLSFSLSPTLRVAYTWSRYYSRVGGAAEGDKRKKNGQGKGVREKILAARERVEEKQDATVRGSRKGEGDRRRDGDERKRRMKSRSSRIPTLRYPPL